MNSSEGTIFIVAPREMSILRFKQIVKHYLPKGPITLGISIQPYVAGFDGQPQFRMLEPSLVQPIIDKVNSASKTHKIKVIEYSQSDLASILSMNDFKRVLLVNGSWKYTFQNHEAYKVLIKRDIPFKYISPFVDEDEAKAYEKSHSPEMFFPAVGSKLSEEEMFEIAAESAKQSFDYSFQTGVSLGRRTGLPATQGRRGDKYEFLLEAFNKVVPYQTYALHHGNAREKHVSGVHDTTHYDTIHAEMYLLTKALAEAIDLEGATLFINLLPCPSCARTLSQTKIREVVYQNDHSDGYATKLLQDCGISVRQAVYNRK